MILTDLPPEILIILLYHLPPSSFVTTVTTCRKLRGITLENRKLLLSNLRRIPGAKQGLEDLTNAELLRLFRRRAAENLIGVGFLHDRHIYSFDPSAISSIDASKSALSTRLDPKAALVCRSCPLLHLFDIEGHNLVPKGVIDPLGACDHVRQPYEILKVVHNECGGVSILHRSTNALNTDTGGSVSPDFLYITHLYTRWSMSWRTEWALIEPPVDSLPEREFRVSAMAVARPGVIAISWKRGDRFGPALIWIYVSRIPVKKFAMKPKNAQENESILYHGFQIYDSSESTSLRRRNPEGNYTPFKSIEIELLPNKGSTRHCLKLSYPGQPVQQEYKVISVPSTVRPEGDLSVSSSSHEYTTDVDIGRRGAANECRFAVAKPFYGFHSRTHTSPRCRHDYLALGIAVDDDATAFILTTKKRTWTCRGEVDLDLPDRNGHWKAVARLGGYRRPDTNLNGIAAYSAGSTRIAIANWTEIYIWPLEPGQLLGEPFHDGYYPRRRGLSSMVLSPAVIPVGSVVHGLTFVEENRLWALTSKGLILFDLGPRCSKIVRMSCLATGTMDHEVDGAPGYWV